MRHESKELLESMGRFVAVLVLVAGGCLFANAWSAKELREQRRMLDAVDSVLANSGHECPEGVRVSSWVSKDKYKVFCGPDRDFSHGYLIEHWGADDYTVTPFIGPN